MPYCPHPNPPPATGGGDEIATSRSDAFFYFLFRCSLLIPSPGRRGGLGRGQELAVHSQLQQVTSGGPSRFTQAMSMHQTTVLVADARVLVRNGIKALVVSLLGEVCFVEVSDGDSLVRTAQHAAVRLAIIDPDMPRMEGGRRLHEFSQCHPQIPLVVVSTISSPDILRRMASIPTLCAFVSVSASVDTFRLALEAAMQGQRLSLGQVDPRTPPEATLTPRQQEVRSLLRAGMSNKSIAGALGISESTVKNHITEIFKTLKATNRIQAAQLDVGAD